MMTRAWVAAALWMCPVMAMAATIELRVDGAAEVAAGPGDALTVDVFLDGVTVNVDAFSGRLLASQSEVLTVTARTWGSQGFSQYPNTSASVPWPLNPTSPYIGGMYFAGTVTPAQLDGIPVETLTVAISENWDEQELTLVVDDLLLVDHDGQPVEFASGTLTIASGSSGCTDPPVLLTAESVRAHGSAGAFGVDLLSGGRVDSRGGAIRVEAVYDMDVTVSGATASSGAPSATASGNKITVDVEQPAGNSPLLVDFTAVNGACETPTSLCVRLAAGDVTGDGSVNIFDLVSVRNSLNQGVTEANFRADVNADGSINIFDLVAVRNNLNQNVAECP